MPSKRNAQTDPVQAQQSACPSGCKNRHREDGRGCGMVVGAACGRPCRQQLDLHTGPVARGIGRWHQEPSWWIIGSVREEQDRRVVVRQGREGGGYRCTESRTRLRDGRRCKCHAMHEASPVTRVMPTCPSSDDAGLTPTRPRPILPLSFRRLGPHRPGLCLDRVPTSPRLLVSSSKTRPHCGWHVDRRREQRHQPTLSVSDLLRPRTREPTRHRPDPDSDGRREQAALP